MGKIVIETPSEIPGSLLTARKTNFHPFAIVLLCVSLQSLPTTRRLNALSQVMSCCHTKCKPVPKASLQPLTTGQKPGLWRASIFEKLSSPVNINIGRQSYLPQPGYTSKYL
jgi:hypothetical protein